MDRQRRILLVGHGGVPTGVARVIRSVFRRFDTAEYDFHQLSVNYGGDPHSESWPLYRADRGGDSFGVRRLADLIEKLRPVAVFTCCDLWVNALYLDVLDGISADRRPHIICYCPVESAPVDPTWVSKIDIVSRFVVFTQFARREVLSAVGADELSFLCVIPHGVDSNVFAPMAANREDSLRLAKRELARFTDAEDSFEQDFIVLNANRNQERKRIDTTIAAFALFARDKPPNVKLYIHTGLNDAGWDVVDLARRYAIEDRLIATVAGENDVLPDATDAHLNLVYNASDVGVNTATCEGWGLVAFEHAATGAPQVMPEIENLKELWSEAAVTVSPCCSFHYPQTHHTGHMVRAEDVAEALEKLYADNYLRTRVAQACYERATDSSLRWESIAAKWRQLFDEVICEDFGHHSRV